MDSQVFNEMIVVTVTQFSGTSTPDKNGNHPVMLQCIAGRMPNRNVLSGTVADRAGLQVGKTYLVQCRETGTDKVFGKDYTFVAIERLDSALDIVRACKELGKPEIFNVERPEGFEGAYHRKGNAIEGVRTKRIKEGLYEPAYPRTSTDHRTADEVIAGRSITTARPDQVNMRPEDLLNESENDRKEGGRYEDKNDRR